MKGVVVSEVRRKTGNVANAEEDGAKERGEPAVTQRFKAASVAYIAFLNPGFVA
jgi:hypothetical protein